MTAAPLTFGSLFSGVGGFDLGFERVGMECRWQVEIDEKCRAVLARHFPDADRSVTDIRDANRDNLPTADVWCGGFPCQDLSVAGKRKGLAGERSGLWYEFHRLIVSAKPKWVVIENVPGLLSSNDGRDFAILLGGLTGRIPEVPDGGWGNAGFVRGNFYSVAYRVLDAQFFGVPQRRRRVFIVGSLGTGRAAEVLFERESGPGDTPPERTAGKAAPTLFASGAGTDRTASAGSESEFCIEVVAPLGSHHRRDDLDNDTYVARAQSTRQTHLAGDADNFITYGVRRLTPQECEKLMGWPDGWTEYGLVDGALVRQSDSARYRQCGNGVVGTVSEWLGRRIQECEA